MVFGTAVAGCSDAQTSQRHLVVAGASDLRAAFVEIGDEFTKRTGITVDFSFGSSGQLREQIINGAPFDVFASANAEYVDEVIKMGKGDVETRAVYAVGRLALVVSGSASLPLDLADLKNPTYRRIAIANPQHAPYGVAARQVLVALDINDDVRERLIYGENVSDALRIVQSGNADTGLVALSLVINGEDRYVIVPTSLHKPITQTIVVTAPGAAHEAAKRFVQFVTSETGRAVMSRYGFDPAVSTEISVAP